jgi:selenoprotein W-related protein
LTTKIIEKFKQQLSSLTLVPSDGGCFELTLDGDLVYSKLESGEFPDESAMVELVGSRLA